MLIDEIAGVSNSLSPFYSRFRVGTRILLTGHSHQAWPDAGYIAQQKAWLDAAEYVDEKWDLAFEKAETVKEFFARLMSDACADNYTLGASTHELLVRFLSALDLKNRPRIVTTDGEFHSMRRQLHRLAEEGIEIVHVPVTPVATLTQRMAAELSTTTAAVMMSAVMFKDAMIVPELKAIAAATSQEVPLLVDAYHALNVVPFDLESNGLEDAFILGGGYKYCQFGEGNCFLRIPPDCNLRPIITGWYAEFSELGRAVNEELTRYPTGGDRFLGSTYDPSSHYRACGVIEFFQEQGLTSPLLRQISQHQLNNLREGFDDLDCDPDLIKRSDEPLTNIGGFLALKSVRASDLQKALKERGVWTDQRDGYLRLGPAPYVSDTQLRDAVAALGDAIKKVS